LPKKLYPSQPVVGVGAIIICDGFWRKILKRLIFMDRVIFVHEMA